MFRTKSNSFFFPSSFPEVINVGAYEFSNIYSGDRVRADFTPKIKESNAIFLSSNYGDIDIWAPGDNIPIFLPYSGLDNPWKVVNWYEFCFTNNGLCFSISLNQ